MYKKLILDESPLVLQKKLASVVGVNGAIFLQQVHYWLSKKGKEKDGRIWIYNTYEGWQKNFPFWSIRNIRTISKNLQMKGVLITARHNKHGYDRTLWYGIDNEKLQSLLDEANCQNRQMHVSEVTNASVSSDKSICQNEQMHVSQSDRPIPEEYPREYTPQDVVWEIPSESPHLSTIPNSMTPPKKAIEHISYSPQNIESYSNEAKNDLGSMTEEELWQYCMEKNVWIEDIRKKHKEVLEAIAEGKTFGKKTTRDLLDKFVDRDLMRGYLEKNSEELRMILELQEPKKVRELLAVRDMLKEMGKI